MHGGHVHEAFMTIESPVTLLNTISQTPPNPLQETIPNQADPETVWIPGYWDWSQEHGQFVWCSGNWRRPPPGHTWIRGYWRQFDGGWVRLKGFWSEVPLSETTYISLPPPDQINENPSSKPGNDYFWMAGYWKYENQKYTWYSGKWEKADINWIYVPAKYVWRPEGYIFVPAFWDFPLDRRGTAYPCMMVSVGQTEIVYMPEWIIEPTILIQECLLFYPDYYYFYFYYAFFDSGWWSGCGWCPPWWGWGWWWLPWADHWALWWWWAHPGFPAPLWLSPEAMMHLAGPPQALMNEMKSIVPPMIVTPNGVITPGALLNALGNRTPLFPQDPSGLQEEASQGKKPGSTDRPGGSKGDHTPQPLPETTPRPPANRVPGLQPTIPGITPPTVVTPPRPMVPVRPITPPTQTQPPSQITPPQYQPQIPPSQTRPIYPQPQPPQRIPPQYQPQIPPSQTQPPSTRPQTPNWIPPQTNPTYPQIPPTRPQITPPSQYQPQIPGQQTPRLTPPSQYQPQIPQQQTPRLTPPSQYQPQQTPQIQTQPYNKQNRGQQLY